MPRRCGDRLKGRGPREPTTRAGAAQHDAGAAEHDAGPGEPPTAALVDASALETLRNGFHYEMWAIIDGAPVTIGKFNVDASGVIVDLDGIAHPGGLLHGGRDLSVSSHFVITIEAAGDNDITPSDTKYLGGACVGHGATLTVGSATALGSDFTAATGIYILATPTDGPETNEHSGVWWVNKGTEPASPGLDLPELPEGWVYEGWAIIDGVVLSTGRFVDPVGEDDFDDFSGPLPGPALPGEDFLENAPAGLSFPADLRGATLVITVEPEPDDDERPFTLKPLVADVPENAAVHQSLPMSNQAVAFPEASVTLVAP